MPDGHPGDALDSSAQETTNREEGAAARPSGTPGDRRCSGALRPAPTKEKLVFGNTV